MSGRSLLLGFTVMSVITLALVGLMALGTYTAIGPIGLRLTRTSQIVSVYAWLVGLVLVGVLIAAGFETQRRHDRLPALYGPAIVTAVAFMGLMQVIALRSLDMMDAKLERNWSFLYEPETSLLTLVLYIGLAAGLAWKAAVIERGHGLEWAVLTLMLGIPLATATIVMVIALNR